MSERIDLSHGGIIHPKQDSVLTSVQRALHLVQETYKPRSNHFYDYETSAHINSRYIIGIIKNDLGPYLASPKEEFAFIQQTMRAQEEFLARIEAQRTLGEINRDILGNKGELNFLYGGLRNHGATTSTKFSLKIYPSEGDDSPQLEILLIGDGKKFSAGERDYITHMAIGLADRSGEDDIVEQEATALKGRLLPIEIDPSLDTSKYKDSDLDELKAFTKARLIDLLTAKLEEREESRRPERERPEVRQRHAPVQFERLKLPERREFPRGAESNDTRPSVVPRREERQRPERSGVLNTDLEAAGHLAAQAEARMHAVRMQKPLPLTYDDRNQPLRDWYRDGSGRPAKSSGITDNFGRSYIPNPITGDGGQPIPPPSISSDGGKLNEVHEVRMPKGLETDYDRLRARFDPEIQLEANSEQGRLRQRMDPLGLGNAPQGPSLNIPDFGGGG